MCACVSCAANIQTMHTYGRTYTQAFTPAYMHARLHTHTHTHRITHSLNSPPAFTMHRPDGAVRSARIAGSVQSGIDITEVVVSFLPVEVTRTIRRLCPLPSPSVWLLSMYCSIVAMHSFESVDRLHSSYVLVPLPVLKDDPSAYLNSRSRMVH